LNAHAYGLPPWFGLALMASVCGAAFWRGGREEQMTAGALLLSWVATIILRDPQWIGPQWGAFVADIFLLIFLVGLALRSAKYWPIFAAGFHLLAVVTHSARMIDKAMGSWAYATAAVIWAYLVIIALAVGTWNTWRSHGQPTNADDDPADSGDTRR
jgi:hypothetical protein